MSIKTTVITGATSGIGKETALALAKKDHTLYLLVRNTIKGDELKQEIITKTGNKNVHIVKCDLSDLQSVREAAAELNNGKLFAINVLINNAGGMFDKKELSKDGFEMTFVTNHLGHFLLTTSILPLLEKGHARIINLSSEAHKMGKANFDDLQWEQRPYSAIKAYGAAKLFNLYFTKTLAEKYADKGISSFAVHPGIVRTGFGTGTSGLSKFLLWIATPFMISPEEGAKTSVFLATEPGMEAKSSQYFVKCKMTKSSVLAWSEANRNMLWDISKKLVGKSAVAGEDTRKKS
ncbi:NAD(P)-dependent dehydrogenase, short-chain alcohol dehydrogenase family [Mucilaginibacter mallensis]|uniref:NAD(P)-dependent dehydrogenase, short-chain alcohol dehydrogenase family n=1 Tax=Mucilaginibacter mallensis TaxID=652787 RepID=A0A1H1X0Y5_MUCMA|nr:SDR family oxidoreductase [Mucilaginibacter mallensis]SDT02993.1 NAD(P)-dependent dehydrogenase, short-chain alcohol dehydrogenase family [Mucilaginibacter mallensis]